MIPIFAVPVALLLAIGLVRPELWPPIGGGLLVAFLVTLTGAAYLEVSAHRQARQRRRRMINEPRSNMRRRWIRAGR